MSTYTPVLEVIEPYLTELNGEQKIAAYRCIEFYFDKHQKSHVLSGAAGTGKTFTFMRITEALKAICNDRQKVFRVAFAAPTTTVVGNHEKDIEELKERGNDLTVYSNTIHSLLHVKPGKYNEDGVQKLEKNKSSKQHAEDFTLIVIDECTMLDDDIYSFIQALQNVKVLFVGDIYQLPPVDVTTKDIPKDYIKLSPVFERPADEISYLKTPVRYAGNIAIVCQQLIESIDNTSCEKISYPLKSMGDDVKIYTNYEDWTDSFVNTFKEHPPTRAIFWRNISVQNFNKEVQKRLYGCADGFFREQQLLSKTSITRKQQVDNKFITVQILKTGELIKIVDVEKKTVSVNLPIGGGVLDLEVYVLEIDSKRMNTIVTTPTLKGLGKLTEVEAFELNKLNSKRIEKTLDEKEIIRYHQLRNIPKVDNLASRLNDYKKSIKLAPSRDRGLMWGLFYQTLNDFTLIAKSNTYMYALQNTAAMTINQAQGSTIERLYINVSDISSCQQFKLCKRLLYTGTSRAKLELHAYSSFADMNEARYENKVRDPFLGIFS